jgi:hypothetical protein
MSKEHCSRFRRRGYIGSSLFRSLLGKFLFAVGGDGGEGYLVFSFGVRVGRVGREAFEEIGLGLEGGGRD